MNKIRRNFIKNSFKNFIFLNFLTFFIYKNNNKNFLKTGKVKKKSNNLIWYLDKND